MNDKELAAYLDRIGTGRPAKADTAALHALHRAHLLAVPFENLSIHLGEPVSLEPADLVGKIVTRRRGGFCYELNGAFALLLSTLGFDVRLLAARVFGDDRPGPPFDHLALLVHTVDGDGPWLADVGFGKHSEFPLCFGERGRQDDPAGAFLLAEVMPGAVYGSGAGDGTAAGDIDVIRDGQPQYRLELRERALADFGPTCWWQQTSPESHFTRTTICSRLTARGRISISGRTLLRTADGTRTEQELPSDDAVLAAYRDYFGIILDHVPVPAGRPVSRAAETGWPDG
jgi:N-hydroxyarylamine O-acetyltransferase